MAAIELATAHNLQDILEIEARCFTGDAFNQRQFSYLLSKARAKTWIAWNGPDAQGYCIGLFPVPPRPARLYSIAVLPQYRSQGIAQSLLQRLMDESLSKHYTRVRLEVSCNNEKAVDLYERNGFVTIAVLPGYYYGNIDGRRMELCASKK